MDVAERTQTKANGIQSVESFQKRFNEIADNVASVVVTSEKNIRLAILGLFAQGHVLLEDLPGVGKTLLAKTIADSIEGKFSRIQFTSDLLPTNITGTSVTTAFCWWRVASHSSRVIVVATGDHCAKT